MWTLRIQKADSFIQVQTRVDDKSQIPARCVLPRCTEPRKNLEFSGGSKMPVELRLNFQLEVNCLLVESFEGKRNFKEEIAELEQLARPRQRSL